MDDYWLTGWLGSLGITTPEGATTLLKDHGALAEARDVASQWQAAPPKIRSPEQCLLAGPGLDLTPKSSCSRRECRSAQIGTLFRHAWHYYDQILLPDFAGELVLASEEGQDDSYRLWLDAALDTYFELRRIGASQLVSFYPRPPEWLDWSTELTGPNVEAVHLAAERLAETITDGLEIERIREEGEKVAFELLHPRLGFGIRYGGFESGLVDFPPEAQQKGALAQLVASDAMPGVLRDLAVAEALGAPIGMTDRLHSSALALLGQQRNVEDVVLRLEFPTLPDVPIEALLAVRNENRLDFEAFRAQLRLSLRELGREEDSSKAAAEIEASLLRPALAKIERDLGRARDGLRARTATSLTLGAVSTTCGSLLGASAAVAAGGGLALALGLVGRAAFKYLDEAGEARSSDFFLLWKAVHAH